jgi:hypothetical protein
MPEWNCSDPRRRHAPLEEQGAVGPARDVREAVAGELADRLGTIDGLPVDGARRVLDEQPRSTLRHSASAVGRERQLAVALGVGADRVVVVRDEVHFFAPAAVVVHAGVVHDHEVGGDRDVRGHLAQHGALGEVVPEEGIRGEPLEVQKERRVV